MWMTKKPTDKLNLCQGVASSKWTMGNQEENFLTQKLNFIKYSHEIPSIFPGSRRGRLETESSPQSDMNKANTVLF